MGQGIGRRVACLPQFVDQHFSYNLWIHLKLVNGLLFHVKADNLVQYSLLNTRNTVEIHKIIWGMEDSRYKVCGCVHEQNIELKDFELYSFTCTYNSIPYACFVKRDKYLTSSRSGE